MLASIGAPVETGFGQKESSAKKQLSLTVTRIVDS